VPAQVAVGSPFEIKARVRNEGSGALLEFPLFVDGDQVGSEVVYLGPGATAELLFTVTLYQPGLHQVWIDELEPPVEFEVLESPPF